MSKNSRRWLQKNKYHQTYRRGRQYYRRRRNPERKNASVNYPNPLQFYKNHQISAFYDRTLIKK